MLLKIHLVASPRPKLVKNEEKYICKSSLRFNILRSIFQTFM